MSESSGLKYVGIVSVVIGGTVAVIGLLGILTGLS